MLLKEFFQQENFSNKGTLQTIIHQYFKRDKDEFRTNFDKKILSSKEKNEIQNLYEKIVNQKYPLEYAFNNVSFFGKDFYVDQRVIIPRPETEYMILAVNSYLKKNNKQNYTLIDVGTGSGILGILTTLQNSENIGNTIFCDISKDALEVAKINAQKHIPQHSKTFIQADLLDFDIKKLSQEKDIIITANLPYIPQETFFQNVEENVKKREPHIAFLGGNDGLDLYHKMLNQILQHNIQPVIFAEMISRQLEKLQNKWGNFFIFEKVETFHFNIIICKISNKK